MARELPRAFLPSAPSGVFLRALRWIGLLLPSLTMAATLEPARLAALTNRLATVIAGEQRDWQIGGIAIALVHDQEILWSAGFGEARADSVFRCGSISKLFTAVGVMQQVEAGRLDLDAPLERYLPGILPVNPFTNSGPVTLRQVLCHRSGMVREAPVGGYLDGDEPSLEATLASLAGCVLATPPKAKTRYSNVGPSLAGQAVARVSGKSFVQYQKDHLFRPLGLTNSAWLRRDVPPGRLLPSGLRVADGRGGFVREVTPVFDLGTIPAGNLFTTVGDLGRFIAMLAAGGRAPDGSRVLRAESLATMFTPQLTADTNGFGLGFSVSRYRGQLAVSHNGAVYGHASSLVFLPDSKFGVAVMGNEDIVNARIQRIANLALDLLLATRGVDLPAPPVPVTLTPGAVAELAGDFESASYWAQLELRDGVLAGNLSGQPARFTPVGPRRFLVDSRMHDAMVAEFTVDSRGRATAFQLGPQVFHRVPDRPPVVPAEWMRYAGSYGPRFIPLVISARHGHLYAMTENMVDYRLTPVNRHVFELPPGMYVNEYLVFLADQDGRPVAASLAGMVLPRHPGPPPAASR